VNLFYNQKKKKERERVKSRKKNVFF
jgi:hypothetical protein